MKQSVMIVAALVLVLSGSQRAVPQPAPYELNVVLSLTGPGAFLGSSAQASLKALESAANREGGIRGQPIRFVFYDDQSKPEVSVQLTNTIAEKNVPVILGSSLAALCNAMAAATKTGPVIWCFSAAVAPEKDSNMYGVIMRSRDLVAGIMRYFRDRGFRRFGLITGTDASGQAGEADLQDALKRPGNSDLKLVVNEHMNPADLSAAAQIARVKSASPDAVLVFVPGTPFATVLRSMKDAGFDVPVATTMANMNAAQMKEFGQLLPTNLFFNTVAFIGHVAPNDQARKAQQFFFSALKQSNVVADAGAGNPWDAAVIVVNALRRLGTTATAKQLRDYIESLHDYAGISGVYDFRAGTHFGLSQKDVIVVRWDQDKSDFQVVSGFGGAAAGRR